MRVVVLALIMLLALGGVAHASSLGKPVLQRIRIDQRIGESVPLEAVFQEDGEDHPLEHWIGERPVILALVYNRCPMLCSQVLHGLLGVLKAVDLEAGTHFDILAVSFDPTEDTAITRDARRSFLRSLKRDGAATGVHFLTGEAEPIAALTDAVGFRYEYDKELGQYAHPSALMVLTPEGKVARYFFGTEYSPRNLRLALREASDGKVGSITDDLLLLCYRYDPEHGTYSATVVNAIRVSGAATLLALGIFIVRSVRRERRRPKARSPQMKGEAQ